MSNIKKVHVKGKVYDIKDPNSVGTDQVSAWTNRAITPITSYINNVGYANCYYNETLKLATFSFNCNISATGSGGSIIMSGLPKSVALRAAFSVSQGTATAPSARLYVNRAGQVVADGPIPSVGWYNGSVTYPYSSL